MKDVRYEEINKEIQKFLSDKKSLFSKIPMTTIKNSKKQLKPILSQTVSDFLDPTSYQEIIETKIKTIYSNLKTKNRSLSVKPRNGFFTYNDVFNILTRFIERDMKKLLSEKYFVEAKRYKTMAKKDSDNVIYQNIIENIKKREDIINTYFIFILSFYKNLPSLLKGMREEN